MADDVEVSCASPRFHCECVVSWKNETSGCEAKSVNFRMDECSALSKRRNARKRRKRWKRRKSDHARGCKIATCVDFGRFDTQQVVATTWLEF